MKFGYTAVTLALGLAACGLVTACRGPSANGPIDEHIAGTWMAEPTQNPSSYRSLTFRPDGALLRTSTNGVTQSVGTWRTESNLLVLTMAETNYVTSRWSGKKLPLPLETRYQIIRTGEHALVLAQAPPITLFGSDDKPIVSFTAARVEMRFQR